MNDLLAPLPIDDSLPDIVETLRSRQTLVLVAPPGAGKTTRVPPALAAHGSVFLLQPRRVAARSIARRIAAEQGWTLGEEVGWHVRFDYRAGPQTRLLVATEGMLTARLVDDPLLSGFTTIVLDEFHERTQHADLALALGREALRARSDLRLVVMSATLDPAPLVAYLGGAPVIEIPGRVHPVEVSYAPGLGAAAASRAALDRAGGHVLCFLPGMADIRRVESEVARLGLPPRSRVVTLHGSMDADQQDAALAPCADRKVILSTNVAETSLTIDGVTEVVDSGFHKVLRFDAARGLDRLETERISLDSAVQRAGRAGRTAPGWCVRLWDRRDILAEHREPELARIDLARPLLDVLAAGEDPSRFEWLDPPSPDRVELAFDLLRRLGFVEGRRLARAGIEARRLPLHPRLAAVVFAAGGGRRAVRACALLAEGLRVTEASPACSCDLFPLVDRFAEAPRGVREAARQIEALLGSRGAPSPDPSQDDGVLLRALLAGYPDRVAQRREPGSRRLLLASGSGARLDERSGVHDGAFLLALDVAAAGERGGEGALVRQASLVESSWLQASDLERVHFFDEATGLVRAEEQERYGALTLRRRATAPDLDVAQELLARAVEARGLGESVERWLRRATCAGVTLDRGALVQDACRGRTSLADVDVAAAIPAAARRRIDQACPETLAVPSGRRLKLEYRADGRVHLAAKLQELFGWAETPRVGAPPRPVVIELLAPNGRPVQTTTDLRSFWTRTYPEVRKELRGRYPKHPWPEDPWSAKPTVRVQRRRG